MSRIAVWLCVRLQLSRAAFWFDFFIYWFIDHGSRDRSDVCGDDIFKTTPRGPDLAANIGWKCDTLRGNLPADTAGRGANAGANVQHSSHFVLWQSGGSSPGQVLWATSIKRMQLHVCHEHRIRTVRVESLRLYCKRYRTHAAHVFIATVIIWDVKLEDFSLLS